MDIEFQEYIIENHARLLVISELKRVEGNLKYVARNIPQFNYLNRIYMNVSNFGDSLHFFCSALFKHKLLLSLLPHDGSIYFLLLVSYVPHFIIPRYYFVR